MDGVALLWRTRKSGPEYSGDICLKIRFSKEISMTMEKQPLLVIIWLVLLLLLVAGCAGHPEGWTGPRELTDTEKARVIAAALDTPEIRARLEKEPVYTTSLSWAAITWNGSQVSAFRVLDYNWKQDPNYALVTEKWVFYALELFNFGEPPNWQIYIAVNPIPERHSGSWRTRTGRDPPSRPPSLNSGDPGSDLAHHR